MSKSLSLTTAQLDSDNSSVGHFAARIVCNTKSKYTFHNISTVLNYHAKTCSKTSTLRANGVKQETDRIKEVATESNTMYLNTKHKQGSVTDISDHKSEVTAQ